MNPAAPRFVGFEAWASLLPASGDFSDPQLRFLRFVHHDWTGIVVSILAGAAPGPILRLQNQAPLQRITVHVAQLLDSFVLGEHHEIVEPRLPDPPAFQRRLPERQLIRIHRAAQTRKQTSGECPASPLSSLATDLRAGARRSASVHVLASRHIPQLRRDSVAAPAPAAAERDRGSGRYPAAAIAGNNWS